jgi:hypothetical protein
MTFRRALANIADCLTALKYRLEFRIRGRGYRLPLERAEQLGATIFERRLQACGAWFAFDEVTETYRVENIDGLEGRVCLSNIARELSGDGDIYRVVRFAKNLLSGVSYPHDWSKVKHQVLWDIQSNTIVDQSDLTFHLSDQTHQVPVIFDPNAKQLLFLASHMLIAMSVSEEIVGRAANKNLSVELRNAELLVRELDGIRSGTFHSLLPFKAALILAPNLREVAEPVLGWPLFAVIPNQSSVYLFNAKDFDGVTGFFETLPGVGDYVFEQFEFGAYPLSTEIFEISDEGVRAVAEYWRHPPGEMAEEAQAE